MKDEDAVQTLLRQHRPDVMIHCAAYTAVDAAEADEAGAFHVNATATRQVAAACQKIGAQLVYPSADYVFAGDADRPLRPVDPAAPLNVYGRSKRAGEHSALAADGALVVRTSWLYGRGGPNFVDTITRRARKVGHLDVVDDQIGRPTWTATLAWAMAELIEQATGIFHATEGRRSCVVVRICPARSGCSGTHGITAVGAVIYVLTAGPETSVLRSRLYADQGRHWSATPRLESFA